MNTDTKDKAMTGLSDAIEALKPFAKMANIYDCWEDNRSGSPLVLEHAEGGAEFDCTIGDLRRARSALERLTTSPAPQAGEIERAAQYFVDKQDDGRFRLNHLFGDGHTICIAISPGDSYGDELDLKIIAQTMNEHKSTALHSAQAPAPAKGEMVARAVLDAVEKTWGQSTATS